MSIVVESNPHQYGWWWSIVETATGRVLMRSAIYESRQLCERGAERAVWYLP